MDPHARHIQEIKAASRATPQERILHSLEARLAEAQRDDSGLGRAEREVLVARLKGEIEVLGMGGGGGGSLSLLD